MNKKLKTIQVPVSLVSNEFRKDEVKISPKTTYLYVWLKILFTDYTSNILRIQPSELREYVGWKTNVMLKNHLSLLKELNYITYQDTFDNGALKPNQMLEIKVMNIKENFVQLTEKSIKEKILKATNQPEKAVRLCYLIKRYTNKEFGYCWLTYDQIRVWGNIRKQDIKIISEQLERAKLLDVTTGVTFKDNSGRIRKENNKYRLNIY